MSALARVEALADEIREGPSLTTYDIARHARVIRALLAVDLALVEVVVAQDARIARLEERLG